MPAASCANRMPAFGAAINGGGEPLTGTVEANRYARQGRAPLLHGRAARRTVKLLRSWFESASRYSGAAQSEKPDVG